MTGTIRPCQFFCVLRDRFQTLWAAGLAHGSSNIGIVAFFLAGPHYGLGQRPLVRPSSSSSRLR